MEMSERALEARRAYKRKWYAANKEKNKEYQERYWQRKADLAAADPEQDDSEREAAP